MNEQGTVREQLKEILFSHEDVDGENLAYLQRSKYPKVIYGAGNLAESVAALLRHVGITNYIYASDFPDREGILNAKDVDQVYPSYDLIIGIGNPPSGISCKFQNAHRTMTFTSYFGVEGIDRSFLESHMDDFEKVVTLMDDDFSKNSVLAYIKAKVCRNAAYAESCIVGQQYFQRELIAPKSLMNHDASSAGAVPWGGKGYMIDCGAYDGDSIRNFVDFTEGRFHKVIAFEPDPANMSILRSRVAEMGIADYVETVQKGTSNHKGTEHFTVGEDQSSAISETGEGTIEVDMIDHYTSDDSYPVTLIKMDIEGAELEALRGGTNTILRDSPALAISAYHKTRDLIDLTKFISDLEKGYRFYFRIHRVCLCDAVLYAVSP